MPDDGDDVSGGAEQDDAINENRDRTEENRERVEEVSIASQNRDEELSKRLAKLRDDVRQIEGRLEDHDDESDDPDENTDSDSPLYPGSFFDLSAEVPDDVLALKRAQPDDYRDAFATMDATDYADSGDDIGHALKAAAEQDKALWLGDGDYVSTDPSVLSGSVWGMIGRGATIDIESYEGFAFQPNTDRGVIAGVDWDITGTDWMGDIFAGNFTEEFWAEDVTITGAKQGRDVKGGYTFRPHMVEKDAKGFCEGVVMTDGDAFSSGEDTPEGGERSQGITTDPGHRGLLGLLLCDVRMFLGNGYYISYNPYAKSQPNWSGRAVLWRCTAVNNNRGNFRVAMNDEIIGGYTEVNRVREGVRGQPVVVDYATAAEDRPTRIVGVGVNSGEYNRDCIVCRNFYYTQGNPVFIEFEKVLMNATGYNPPIRITSGNSNNHDHVDEHAERVNVTFEDCFLYYDGPEGHPMFRIDKNADVEVNNCRIRSENGPVFRVSDDAHGLVVDGEECGRGDHDAEEFDLKDPRINEGTLPNMTFAQEF